MSVVLENPWLKGHLQGHCTVGYLLHKVTCIPSWTLTVKQILCGWLKLQMAWLSGRSLNLLGMIKWIKLLNDRSVLQYSLGVLNNPIPMISLTHCSHVAAFWALCNGLTFMAICSLPRSHDCFMAFLPKPGISDFRKNWLIANNGLA